MTTVAYHDHVILFGWSESSSHGCKIVFKLPNREALSCFDKATRRRGKRAGQRYQAALSTIDVEPQPILLDEFWLAGASWSHQDGAKVAFSVTEVEPYRERQTADQKLGEPLCCWMTLVEIDDNEQPIDQDKADLLERVEGEMPAEVGAEAPPEPEPPKGGPWSQHAAMLAKDEEFCWYISEKIDIPERATEEQADAWIKEVVGIESKVQLDHDPGALERYRQTVQQPYLRWLRG